MADTILELKKLNAAYIAALEWDRCPDSDELEQVKELFNTGVSDEDLTAALDDNSGRRPDEIASDMSEIIKYL